MESMDNSKTLCAWKLEGNVDIPLICDLGINRKCPLFKTKCPYLHANTTYHWQFFHEDWLNFPKLYSDLLESRFIDVTCNIVYLPKLHAHKLNKSMKPLVRFLGRNCRVDFSTMTIKWDGNSNACRVRQITTASSAVSKSNHSTTFNWYFKDDLDKWELYGNGELSSQVIEKGYQEYQNKGNTAFFVSMGRFQYKVDFSNMKQKNLTSNKEREIRRRPFFDKELSLAVKLQLPGEWDKMNQTDQYTVIKLNRTSNEYKYISRIILLTLPSRAILAVSRVQNPHIWRQFKNRELELKKKYNGEVLNIQKLFYRIKTKYTKDICRDNIDWRIHNTNLRKSYGQGSYFYNSAKHAARKYKVDFLGRKTLLVADVIVGKFTRGTPDLTRPPENHALDALFDTTTDQNIEPSVFVKFDKREYYPSYIVQFT